MEDFDWGSLLSVVVPAVSALAVAVLGFGYAKLKKYVKETEATWDDEILDAFESGVEKGKADAEKAE